jgi:hypothetical protein
MIDDDSQLDHVPCSFHSRELKRIIALLLTCNSCLSQCIYNYLATYLASTVVATVARANRDCREIRSKMAEVAS